MTRQEVIEFINYRLSNSDKDIDFLIRYAKFRGVHLTPTHIQVIIQRGLTKKFVEYAVNWLAVHFHITYIFKQNKFLGACQFLNKTSKEE